MKLKSGIQNYIGIFDGTLIVLHYRPHLYVDSYFSRKSCYAINVQVVCDDRGKTIYYCGGWPGSTHDNRAWRSSKIFINDAEYFADDEYTPHTSLSSILKTLLESSNIQ